MIVLLNFQLFIVLITSTADGVCDLDQLGLIRRGPI